MVTCILPIQCIVECKHRCKFGFPVPVQKFANFHALYKNKPKLLVISFSHVAARLASANILPINMDAFQNTSACSHGDVQISCLFICICICIFICLRISMCMCECVMHILCLEACSLAEASFNLWPITCNSGYLIIRYMTTWFVKVIFKLCY